MEHSCYQNPDVVEFERTVIFIKSQNEFDNLRS